MINTVIFCCLSFAITCLGFWIFIKNFPERRWKAKWAGAVFWIVFLIAGAIQAWDAQHAYIQALQIAFNSIVNGCILKAFYTCDFKAALVWELFYNITCSILKVPLITIKGVEKTENLLSVNVSDGRNFTENLWCLLIILLAILFYIKGGTLISFFIEKKKNVIWLLYGFSAMEYIMLLSMIKVKGQVFKPIDVVSNSFVIMFMLLMGFSIIIYLLYKNSREEHRNLAIQQKILLEEQAVIKGYYEQDAKRLHDVKHILLYVQRCIESQETGKAMKCLKQYLEEVEGCQRRVWTGVPEVDFVVNYEHQKMVKKGIEFKLEADLDKIPISEVEFVIILGNLLDNAIEAAEKCDSGDGSIYLKLRSMNNMFLIQVENTTMEKPRRVKERILSAKENQTVHGWGMENVKQLVNKNEGDYQCRYDKKIFKFIITFFNEGGQS